MISLAIRLQGVTLQDCNTSAAVPPTILHLMCAFMNFTSSFYANSRMKNIFGFSKQS